jgi:hypothetical protein
VEVGNKWIYFVAKSPKHLKVFGAFFLNNCHFSPPLEGCPQDGVVFISYCSNYCEIDQTLTGFCFATATKHRFEKIKSPKIISSELDYF